MQCLNRLIPQCIPAAVSGRISVGGRPVGDEPVAEMSRQVGVVFQNPRTQLFNVRVEDEVAFGPRNLGLEPSEVEDRVGWALACVGMAHLRSHSTHALSGGERQRLAIAAVLAMGSRLLVLDEPMASLDVEGTRAVIDTVRRLNTENGVTVILIEHRLGPAAAIAHRTVLLDQGCVVADGPTERVLGERALLRRLGLRRPAEDTQMIWRDLVEPGPPARSAPLVSLRGVTAGEGRPPALTSLDLTINEGECLALVGDNGAGKSTLARLVAGLLKPRRGVVSWAAGRRPRPATGVGMLFQDPTAQLLCDTVEAEVALGLRNLGLLRADTVDEMLAVVDLARLRGRPVYALSLGEQQRLAVAAVLSLEPRLLILDEPTVGQDWGHMERFMDAVRRLSEAGSTVLLITHDFKLVHHYASRVVVLDQGRVVADGVLKADGVPKDPRATSGVAACASA